MKSFFSKAFDAVTLGQYRRRSTISGNQTDGRVNSASSTLPHFLEHPDHDWSVYSGSLEEIQNLEDDVVFCKNNVYLKYPNRKSKLLNGESPSDSSVTSFTSDSITVPEPLGSIPMKTLSDSSPQTDQDSNIVIPGYFHISTRGSDFGQTLIMNWSPNQLMSQGDHRPIHPLSSSATNKYDKPSVASLSIDLSQMESIRIFYQNDPFDPVTGGEVVICTRERRFKIFIFKHGGLNELIKKFCSWKYFNYQHQAHAHQYLFTVFRPRLSLAELHPEEGLINGLLTDELWSQLKDVTGKVLEKRMVLQTVFFRGLHSSLRSKVWPYLLGIFDYEMTYAQQQDRRKQNIDIYRQINSKREQYQLSLRITPLQIQQLRNDINRTDRSHHFYKGDDNVNLDRLQHILLNYLFVYRSDISYCQGMTDLLSPLLYSLDDDVEAFFCFAVVVEKTAFFKPAKDRVSLRKQVSLLSSLVEFLLPWFYSYLTEIEDGLTFVFVHRWLLVCMKREFKLEDTLTIWEACWTNYSTNYFLFFICVGVLAMYGQRVLDQEMTLNELTVHFSSLSNSLPVDIVLSQARGYLYQFIKSKEVPCDLRQLMSEDFWCQAKSPKLICNKNGTCCKGEDRFSLINLT